MIQSVKGARRGWGVRGLRVFAVAAVLLASAALVACAPARPPDTSPTIRGVIVAVVAAGEGGTIRVVWHESLGEPYELDSIDVSIHEDTDLFDREGLEIGFEDLAVRDIVDVWISGPIAESYPPQGGADALRVVGDFDPVEPLPMPPGFSEP